MATADGTYRGSGVHRLRPPGLFQCPFHAATCRIGDLMNDTEWAMFEIIETAEYVCSGRKEELEAKARRLLTEGHHVHLAGFGKVICLNGRCDW